MKQSSFGEINRSSSGQEIHDILWNAEVHYCIHKSPPPVPILSQKQFNPCTNTAFLRSILILPCERLQRVNKLPNSMIADDDNDGNDFNIILLGTLGSPKRSLSLRFFHKNPLCTSSRLHTCYIKLVVMQSCPLPCYLVPLRPKYFRQDPILEHTQPMFLPQHDRETKFLTNTKQQAKF